VEEQTTMVRWQATFLGILFCLAAGPVPGQEKAAPKEGKNPMVLLSTNMGDIKIELFPDKAPKTVENFLAYVKSGQYDGLIFHRVIPGFMIQGGGLDKDMREKKTERPPIQNEASNGLKNTVGTVAMARTSDPHSASAQFFINVKDNGFLDHRSQTPQGWGYAVFGKVTEGMDVVRKIENVPTTTKGPHQNVPQEAVVIQSARAVE
jgi:peptidyl-prolyl cis-trans isomerase B (cyclophilin B)